MGRRRPGADRPVGGELRDPARRPHREGLTLTGTDGATAELFPPPGVPPACRPGRPEPRAAAPRRIGLLLARKGAVAAGVADGVELLTSKVDTHYVQGRTAAGGWSQQRFARRRDNQAKAAAADGAAIAARILLPDARTLTALVTGGDRTAVDAILAAPSPRRPPTPTPRPLPRRPRTPPDRPRRSHRRRPRHPHPGPRRMNPAPPQIQGPGMPGAPAVPGVPGCRGCRACRAFRPTASGPVGAGGAERSSRDPADGRWPVARATCALRAPCSRPCAAPAPVCRARARVPALAPVRRARVPRPRPCAALAPVAARVPAPAPVSGARARDPRP